MIIVREMLRQAAALPAKTAIICGDRTCSYRRLANRVLGVARFLREQGVRKGDRVLFGAVQTPDFAYMYFGAHAAGAVAVPVDLKLGREKLAYIRRQSEPALVWHPDPDIRTALGGLSFEETKSALSVSCHAEDVPVAVRPDDTADILFTTGTTGKPKGVALSHRNITAGA
ncbi:MAG: AMP-binding protein, partial [Lentisphaerae bacterium]|nr:AMP-binding protein [Lentisphaerota bacterium]